MPGATPLARPNTTPNIGVSAKVTESPQEKFQPTQTEPVLSAS